MLLMSISQTKKIFASTALFVSILLPCAAHAVEKGKVLVVLSSAQTVQLREGKSYKAGYYLDELEVPLRKIMEAGFTPVFANPKGNAVTFDPSSNNKLFFNNDDASRAKAVDFINSIKEIKEPSTFKKILSEGTDHYVGVFIPGGWSPVEDLVKDKDLGTILLSFHAAGKPTGVICHGPAALLSTVSDPDGFVKAMSADDFDKAAKLAQGWPYAGYHLTAFSRSEEHFVEGPKGQLNGLVKFYIADGLAQAGANVDRKALWAVNVIEDREVVSAQQPMSSDAFGDAFVAKLRSAQVN